MKRGDEEGGGGGEGNEGRILWGGRGTSERTRWTNGVEDSFNGHSLSGEEGSQEREGRERRDGREGRIRGKRGREEGK